jgi:WD40 repeat protein
MTEIIELHQIDLHSGGVTKPRWSPNGRFLAIPTESGSIGIFDIESARIVQTLGNHSGKVTAVGWNREGEFIVSGSLDRSVGVWEVKNGRKVAITISGHKEPVHSVEYTNEGAFAMTCSTDRVRALDGFCLESGWSGDMEGGVNEYKDFTAASCSFNTTLVLALAAKNGTLLVLTSLLTAEVLGQVRMEQPIRCLAWSPAETLLAVAAGQTIFAFSTTTEAFNGAARRLTESAPSVDALAFSSDGTLLAARDAQGLQVWHAKTGKFIAKLEDDIDTPSGGRSASAIAFHPSRPLLATVTQKGTAVRILDLSQLR